MGGVPEDRLLFLLRFAICDFSLAPRFDLYAAFSAGGDDQPKLCVNIFLSLVRIMGPFAWV